MGAVEHGDARLDRHRAGVLLTQPRLDAAPVATVEELPDYDAIIFIGYYTQEFLPGGSAGDDPPSDRAAVVAPTQRDRHLQCIHEHGRIGWQKQSGYTRRALGESAISRFKRVIGDALRLATGFAYSPNVSNASSISWALSDRRSWPKSLGEAV